MSWDGEGEAIPMLVLVAGVEWSERIEDLEEPTDSFSLALPLTLPLPFNRGDLGGASLIS